MKDLTMLRELANGEEPYGGGPFDADHVKLYRADARELIDELESLRAIAGGGRCVECGQVESITADGCLAPHHDTGTDELCDGSGAREHEPPNLTVRVLDNEDRKDLERLRAIERRARAVANGLDTGGRTSWARKQVARHILGTE